jgi:hypothetical protein
MTNFTLRRVSQKAALGVTAVVALFMVGFGSASIYHNLKTDNVDGRGYMYASSDCSHVGPSDNDYVCKGSYYQDGGMITIANASVHTESRFLKGQFIDDIWRDMRVSYEASASSQHYITGDQRRSLFHNLPAVLLVIFGAEIIVGLGAIKFINPRKKS